MSVIKIFLNVPLKKVPFGGLFRFDGEMYRLGCYSRRSRVYVCERVDRHDPFKVVSFLFSFSQVVSYYKEPVFF